MNGTARLKCPLCGAEVDRSSVAGDFVYGGRPEQKFYACRACDVAFLYPAMSDAEEKRFYAKEFEKFMEGRSGADFDWSGPEAHIRSNGKQFERRLRFFKDFIGRGKRVLEIGCSSGFMLLPLHERGMEAVGVEPSGGFTSFLKNKRIPVYGSLEELMSVEKDGSFDLVMHFFVLEHMRNPVGFLRDALSMVRPDGYMVFEVPSRDDPLATIYNIPAFHRFYWSVAHHYYFNSRSLKYALDKVGAEYEIIPEQRYDISNHLTWALEGRPGGQGRYSQYLTKEAQDSYRRSMIQTGHCDALVVRMRRS
jgi:2-polyprenyl-3-methyl-5-hydroxy-6-metoxy-1,4-benzoquinol methylase